MLRKKAGEKYTFLIKSGEALKSALFNLFIYIWEKESKPDSWKKTVLIQLYKGSGLREELANQKRKTKLPNLLVILLPLWPSRTS